MSRRWDYEQTDRHLWRKQRKRILARDNYRCQIQLPGCTGIATQADHLVPWTPGTVTHDSQLQAACSKCNHAAGSPEKRNPTIQSPNWLNS